MESNVKKWDKWYENLTESRGAFVYGETPTYELAAKFLEDCETVEDWGCGAGGFLRFCDRAIGVDGSNTPHAQKKFIDLVNYTSESDGIHVRHVLEHNYEWKKILNNILKSARKKIVITMFIPLGDETKEIAHNKKHGVDVPDLLISKEEFMDIVKNYNITNIEFVTMDTATGYNKEEIIYISLLHEKKKFVL